jgi:hypothetical protein
MANSNDGGGTGRKPASNAGKLLRDPKTPKKVKDVAVSDLAQASRKPKTNGEIHSGGRCFGCVLAERARILLAGPGGEVSAQLRPLLVALTTIPNPATVITWLDDRGGIGSSRKLTNPTR